MTNNDVLRRLRYVFDFDDDKMIKLFGLAGLEVTRAQVSDWLKKEEDPDYQRCTDQQMATFLNGLIVDKRGRQDGPPRPPEHKLGNNLTLMKLKIALNLKAEDTLEILKLGGMTMSKHELSAFFRKQGHKHYRECQDQVLRNFLKGMQLKYRDHS